MARQLGGSQPFTVNQTANKKLGTVSVSGYYHRGLYSYPLSDFFCRLLFFPSSPYCPHHVVKLPSDM